LSSKGIRNPPQRLRIVTVGVTQFVHKCQQNIELADSSELDRDTLEPAPQPSRDIRFELEHWQNFAQTTGRNASSVERADIALLQLM